MFESWSGYQNKKGADGPSLVLVVRPTVEDIVRHKSAGQPIWTAKRPERREGEGQGRPESIRVNVLDAGGAQEG